MSLDDVDQAWFWTEQSGEREASADLAAGRSERFDDSAALFDALRSRSSDETAIARTEADGRQAGAHRPSTRKRR